MQFPTVSGSSLERKKYDLPQDFEGALNLVFVAFLRSHQLDVDTWVPLAQRLSAEIADLRYYELPTLWRMNWLSRTMLDGGMRAGIPDKGAREATITLYLDKSDFQQQLAIASEKEIVVLLVDGQGEIVWRTTGRWSPEKEAALVSAVDSANLIRHA